MGRAEVGGGATGTVGDDSLTRSWSRRWLHAARRAPARALPWLPLCAALVGVGIAIASFGQTQLGQETIARHDRRARAPAEPARERNADRARRPTANPRRKAPLVTRGVTVQILDATKGRRADGRVARRLKRLGFSVLAMNTAVKMYDRTTVFWSRPAGRQAAVALARRFGWAARRKPRNLSASVTIHVVVGGDERRR
jgi:hypothetical protein